MKIKERTSDFLVFLIPVMFIVAITLALSGRGLWGIYPAIAVTGIQLFMGLIEGDKIPKKSFWILVIGFLIIHGGGMTGMIYYYYQFGNTAPDFLIMGMHPSWFYFVVVYWLGSLLYQAGFLILMKDQWLSQEKWDNFLEEIKAEDNNPPLLPDTLDVDGNKVEARGEV
ncbi:MULTISPECIES: hypothetical protein [unclassified Jeotgalibaca]|uniref:hypothetical protein n=1 Tax=unclassified Jeotgalibaca TaxID=2621505 RepID=UPI003FD08BBE